MSGQAGWRPRQAREALATVVDQKRPPLRWVAGAVETVEQKAKKLLAQVDAYRDLSWSLAVDET